MNVDDIRGSRTYDSRRDVIHDVRNRLPNCRGVLVCQRVCVEVSTCGGMNVKVSQVWKGMKVSKV